MVERIFRKRQNWPQKVKFFHFFQIGAILASLSTESGRLNNNMSIFCLLSSSFFVKMAENRKCRQTRPTFWSTRHSHGRIFAPIFFKFSGKLQSCLPTFTIKNFKNPLINSAKMAERVFRKSQNWLQKVIFFNFF